MENETSSVVEFPWGIIWPENKTILIHFHKMQLRLLRYMICHSHVLMGKMQVHAAALLTYLAPLNCDQLQYLVMVSGSWKLKGILYVTVLRPFSYAEFPSGL